MGFPHALGTGELESHVSPRCVQSSTETWIGDVPHAGPCFLHLLPPRAIRRGALPWVPLLCSPCLGEGPAVHLTRPRAPRLPQSSPLEPGISSSWLSSLRGPSQSHAHLVFPLSPAQLHATCACCAQTMCQDWVWMWGERPSARRSWSLLHLVRSRARERSASDSDPRQEPKRQVGQRAGADSPSRRLHSSWDPSDGGQQPAAGRWRDRIAPPGGARSAQRP